MWTHYIFLFLSMLTGDGLETLAQSTVAPAPPQVVAPAEAPALSKAPALKKKPVRATKPAAKRPVVAHSKQELPAPSAQPAPAAQPAPIAQPFGTFTLVAAAPTADEVIGKVQDFYNETKSFSATFTQTVTNQTFNKLKPKVSKGKVYILKPGKMRWDYRNKSYKTKADPKVSKSFISDGKHLWAVMHKNKQYYKEDLTGSTLPVALSFLMGTGDLRKEFDVAFDTAGKFGSKSDLLLVLTPKKPSARYKKLWLVVDTKSHAVKQSIVLNSKGDTNAIRFSGSNVNDSSLKNGHFIFNAKANKGFRLIKPPKADK